MANALTHWSNSYIMKKKECGECRVCSFFIKHLFKLTVFVLMIPFEMKTVLSRIHLFIDTHKIVGQHFISNRNGGEENKIAEGQRESVCVRQHVVEKER